MEKWTEPLYILEVKLRVLGKFAVSDITGMIDGATVLSLFCGPFWVLQLISDEQCLMTGLRVLTQSSTPTH